MTKHRQRARATIGSRIEGRRSALYVDRDDLLTSTDLFLREESQKFILNVYGVAGIGKSFFARRIERSAAEQGIITSFVDTSDFTEPLSLMAAVAASVAAGGMPVDGYSMANGRVQRISERLRGLASKASQAAFVGIHQGLPLGVGHMLVELFGGQDHLRDWITTTFGAADSNLYFNQASLLATALAEDINASPSRVLLVIDTYEKTTPELDESMQSCGVAALLPPKDRHLH